MNEVIKPYYQSNDGRITLYCGDCLEVMKQLDSGSIDAVVTSPPYDNLRTYNGYSFDFENVAKELYRCASQGGLVCWNVGDAVVDESETLTSARQAIYFKDVVGFRVHDTMIYQKLGFASPSHNRYHQVFEYVYVLSKGEPRTFNPLVDRKNKWVGKGHFGRNMARQANGTMTERRQNDIEETGMRFNVWLGKTAAQENVCKSLPHPAMMPYWLARDLTLSWTRPADIVLDPFMGSGTTGVACIKTNRRFIGIEISEEYCAIALKRIKEAMAQPMLISTESEQQSEQENKSKGNLRSNVNSLFDEIEIASEIEVESEINTNTNTKHDVDIAA